MDDKFKILNLRKLLQIILNQLDHSDFLFGISKKLFFKPSENDSFKINRFGRILENPIGVAAGPHSQLTQNIVIAWLTGARFIELKTIQTLDELEISKPCIDIQDEGYNCEWSQELKIEESFDQYLNAWIIIHILKDKLKHKVNDHPGVIFNMSVGYDYQGILKDNVQWFLDKMTDASKELEAKLKEIEDVYPGVRTLNINSCIADNVTLSTMHGCPPDEIEKIANYLITERRLHTAIKLNPTLLGKEEVRLILKDSGFETQVPDIAFEHDLNFEEAVGIIERLQAASNGLQFSIKLTNTLESLNHKSIFPDTEQMMYMSGRALHPISIRLALKLQERFNGQLDISFSGGANADNINDIIKCGIAPVTVCTDLLKPGGYGRLYQYIENLRSGENRPNKEYYGALENYAKSVLVSGAYKRKTFQEPDLKTSRKLSTFDCMHAPCVDTCPTHQGIPDYLHYAADGDFDKAFEIIKDTNPFPLSTGMICDHLCQTKCVRIHYDDPVLIREVKRFVAENALKKSKGIKDNLPEANEYKVAIIGGGPSGLSCSHFLASKGFQVTVFESKSEAGGMVSGAIPSFRLTDQAINKDIDNILEKGVEIRYNTPVDEKEFHQIRAAFDFIYIGAGALDALKLNLPGINVEDVMDPLDFLFSVKKGERPDIGENVLIIGGGNTAMDTARTAKRLVGRNGKVSIVYRRTKKQMPADQGEIKAVVEEGIEILELVNPIELLKENGKIKSLLCQRMSLGIKDSSGRPKPEPIVGSEFELEFSTLIPAIGQEKVFDFVDNSLLDTRENSYETQISGVFIGGDAMRGASTAINAIGDGRKAAEEIIAKVDSIKNARGSHSRESNGIEQLMIKKVSREKSAIIQETSLSKRDNFELITTTLSEEAVKQEASRCLKCDELCNLCVTVCPNLAFHPFTIEAVHCDGGNILLKENQWERIDGQKISVNQSNQILHIEEWCNQCGNCTTFCPSADAPYLEKAHLYLDPNKFHTEKDGYYFDAENGLLHTFVNNEMLSLLRESNNLNFHSEHFIIKMEKGSYELKDVKLLEKKERKIDIKTLIEMDVIYDAALSFYL